MTVPSSTYRIQFRDGMTFDRATALVPYLKRLGISHLYASPVFTATTGSSHGYDVCNANEIDRSIGGMSGFRRMADALHRSGLGLIIDIVPNHMAASLENPWWRSIVEWGRSSPFADYFDVNWSHPLTLPILGQSVEEAIEARELQFGLDAEAGVIAIAYFDNLIPLDPRTYHQIPLPAKILACAAEAEAADAETFHDRMRAFLADRSDREDLEKTLRTLSEDRDHIRRLLGCQPWQLLYWQDAARQLNYRRFFEVAGLAGLRVEDPAVFDASHRLIAELLDSGLVDGLRIDHIDGLADPKTYLQRLRQVAGDDAYIVVEKILGAGEQLSEDWPVAGTTGYEFITALSEVFTEKSGLQALSAAYLDFTHRTQSFGEETRAAKRQLIRKNFAGETRNLLTLLNDIGQAEGHLIADERLALALEEILVAFPVYRTYVTESGLAPADITVWERVLSTVSSLPESPLPHAVGFIDRVFRGDASASPKAAEFRRRLQQLTGPLIAKSLEDTMFYRFNRMIALNEVGGEPDDIPAIGLDHFHSAMIERAKRQPHALSATSTHDTKRSEDARARLYAVSEVPGLWREAVSRWHRMNEAWIARLPDGPAPDAETEWMLYQALAGVLPTATATDDTEIAAIQVRFIAYVEKALREAKKRTNWTAVDEAYETAVKTFAHHLLAPDNRAFLSDFEQTLRPVFRAGLFNGLSQTVIKLAAPGVPDIYQGTEGLDFSLVDPDNRRPPDFATLERWLDLPEAARDEAHLSSGALKQLFLAKGLHLRATKPTLFSQGSYEPLIAEGVKANQVIAFQRRHGDSVVIAVAPRFLAGLAAGEWPIGRYWGNTALPLPETVRNRRFVNILTGEEIQARDGLALADILPNASIALLSAD